MESACHAGLNKTQRTSEERETSNATRVKTYQGPKQKRRPCINKQNEFAPASRDDRSTSKPGTSMKCLVRGCPTTIEDNHAMFGFPSKQELYVQWLAAINRKDLIYEKTRIVTDSAEYCICARHFEKKYFFKDTADKFVKHNAIPSLYLSCETVRIKEEVNLDNVVVKLEIGEESGENDVLSLETGVKIEPMDEDEQQTRRQLEEKAAEEIETNSEYNARVKLEPMDEHEQQTKRQLEEKAAEEIETNSEYNARVKLEPMDEHEQQTKRQLEEKAAEEIETNSESNTWEYYQARRKNKERTYLFHKEIEAILTYTNATPYRRSIVKFCCIYCNDGVANLSDPNKLRKHTRTKHMSERIDKVGIFMKPSYKNEVLKLDIHNLECVVCRCPIPTWKELFKHLEEHNVKLNQALKRVIPYILHEDLRQCVLCDQTFTNYLVLDSHMNSHYDNYTCKECGDQFHSKTRLRAHEKVHATGQYLCEVCHESFSLEKFRQRHVRVVHEQAPLLKCLHCSETFQGESKRQEHVKVKHKDKVKPLTCEVCGKVFYCRRYYITHVNQTHAEKNYECKQCENKYSRKHRLEQHTMRVHSKRVVIDVPQSYYKVLDSFKG